MLKKSFKFLGWTLFGIFAFLALYISSVLIISKITVNSDIAKVEEQNAIPIYILSNGVHTDIVVPVKNEIKDWRNQIQFNQTQSKDSLMNYIGFGWGDKGFYLNTPEWTDLKFSTAFNAAFYLGTSAMHATFYHGMDEDEDCVKITISSDEYQKLIEYIEASFQWDESNNPYLIGQSRAAFWGYGGTFSNVSIPLLQIYNRALTEAEILTNYNATRARYGR